MRRLSKFSARQVSKQCQRLLSRKVAARGINTLFGTNKLNERREKKHRDIEKEIERKRMRKKNKIHLMAREKTINNNTNILNAVNKVVDFFSFSV